jgi:hypothetical protein
MRGKEIKGYVLVSKEAKGTRKDFDYLMGLALDFNKKLKASKNEITPKNQCSRKKANPLAMSGQTNNAMTSAQIIQLRLLGLHKLKS